MGTYHDPTALNLRLRVRVGEHFVAGIVLGWMWTPTAATPAPDLFRHGLDTAVRVSLDRTLEQDAAFGTGNSSHRRPSRER